MPDSRRFQRSGVGNRPSPSSRIVKLIPLPHIFLVELRKFLAQARLESLDTVRIGAREDGHELAVAIVAEDVLLPAKARKRSIELPVFGITLDPIDRKRRLELRDRVDIALQAIAELRLEFGVAVRTRNDGFLLLAL